LNEAPSEGKEFFNELPDPAAWTPPHPRQARVRARTAADRPFSAAPPWRHAATPMRRPAR
jgi:hypothetical protein